MAMILADEKLLYIRYKWRRMIFKVKKDSKVCGDNKDVVMNIQLPES